MLKHYERQSKTKRFYLEEKFYFCNSAQVKAFFIDFFLKF